MTGPANDPRPLPAPSPEQELYYLLDEVLSNRREKQKEVTWITSLSSVPTGISFRRRRTDLAFINSVVFQLRKLQLQMGDSRGEKMCEKKSCELLLQFASQTTVSDAIKGKVLNCWRFVGLAKQQTQQNTNKSFKLQFGSREYPGAYF